MSSLEQSNIEHISWSLNSRKWCESKTTIDALLNTDIFQNPGLDVYFFPKVDELNKNDNLCERLSQQFYIDPFFWSENAYESNGFFMCEDQPVDAQDFEGDSKCSISRFLIKELEEKRAKNSYKWQYLSFFTLWISGAKGGTHTNAQILLCFDLTPDVMEPLIKKKFFEVNGDRLMNGALETYTVLAKAMTHHFDESLWKFRVPIRTIEKTRSNINRVAPKNPPEHRFRELVRKYDDMYELSRHIIHARECLKVTADTFQVIEEFRVRFGYPLSTIGGRRPIQILRFYALFLTNIEKRAESFEKRLQNEIQLVYNLIATEEASDSRDLLNRSTISLNEMREKTGTSINHLTDMKDAVKPLESIQKDSASWLKLLAEKKNDDLVSQALLEEHRKSRKGMLNLALLLSFQFWAGILVLGFLISNVSTANFVSGDGEENNVNFQTSGFLSWLRSTFS